MQRPRLLLKPNPTSTRLLLTSTDGESLRAVFPPPSFAHRLAAPTLCEALSLWFQRPLSVVLCADAQGTSSALGLCDELGFGLTTVHYEVEVLELGQRHRPLGSFRDLRRLAFRSRQ